MTSFFFAFLLFTLNEFVLNLSGLLERISETETKKEDEPDEQKREEELQPLKEEMETETPIENYI